MNRRLKWLVNSPLFFWKLRVSMLPPILRIIGKFEPGAVLEIGCGQGDTTGLLTELWPTAEIVATDYDPEQVTRAKSRLKNARVKFERADATRLPFEDGRFDLVVEFNTFHHIAAWTRAIAECARVLKPGGRFAVVDESSAFFIPGIKWFDQPEALFSKNDFTGNAAESGFKKIADVGGEWVFKMIFEKGGF